MVHVRTDAQPLTQPPLQILREWPPGFGGVERVAHELASVWGEAVYSFAVQERLCQEPDPLPVSYQRQRLPCLGPIGRLVLPSPSRPLVRLLRSRQPLHGHLPSPGVLLVLLLARLMHPRRRVTAHWHCFLAPAAGLSGLLFGLYQWMALRLVPLLSGVVTTSPLLADELVRCGVSRQCVQIISCCLSAEQERQALAIVRQAPREDSSLRLLFIGRLDSYKRLDWLLEAAASLEGPWQLDVVGDGPHRSQFEALARGLVRQSGMVHFHGRLSEAAKLARLTEADVLVLPSDRCNEAFGIVQLEAMAVGIPSLAFQCPRSGMGWVGRLPGLEWDQSRRELPRVLQLLRDDLALRDQLGVQARDRYLRLFARRIWMRDLAALTR